MNSDEFLGGEYDNSADLMGLDGNDFLGMLAKLPKEKQADAIKKAVKNKKIILVENNSRLEMEGKYLFLPKEIRDGLWKKRLQLTDTRLYVVKDITNKNTIDMFQGVDNKGVGIGNVANAKLEKDCWFNISRIRMLYAQGTSSLTSDFGEIPSFIRNGEFELEAGQKKLVGLMSNEAFETQLVIVKQVGTYKLDSTKLIEPQTEIKMPVKFTGVGAPVPPSYLKVVFIGQSVIPY